MRGHALALVQNLHRRRRRADLHHCMHQVVRHAVVVGVTSPMVKNCTLRPKEKPQRPVSGNSTLGVSRSL
jgi:hypothetical protein